mmetsp:Transcript_103440/g.183764  ORF Transcript_103440/g.183764 Transcript_103440/m.183764 type:complete len:417 (-) Transcript_103440:66-1316(-)
MVSKLDDISKGKAKARTLRAYLKDDLQLPFSTNVSSAERSTETFAAFLGLMRSCNPLHSRKRAREALPVVCPLVQRFPEVLTGKLLWYKDVHVPLADIIDRTGDKMNKDKMWQLLVWIYMGSGGCLHQAWNCLKHLPCVKKWKDDERQPLEVIRFMIRSVHSCGNLMKVFGGDGLDKKYRLSKDRILYPVVWHENVPALVKAFEKGSEAFHDELMKLPGLRGALTRKEVLILFASSKHSKFRKVGEPSLPFGQGAKNGAMAYLGVPMNTRSDDTQFYHRKLHKKIPAIESAMQRMFPALSKQETKVTIGDVEPCLCAAFVFTGMVTKFRNTLGKDRRKMLQEDSQEVWKAVTSMKGPAGFYPYDLHCKPEQSHDRPSVKAIPYKELQLRQVPSTRKRTSTSLKRLWGPPPKKRREF